MSVKAMKDAVRALPDVMVAAVARGGNANELLSLIDQAIAMFQAGDDQAILGLSAAMGAVLGSASQTGWPDPDAVQTFARQFWEAQVEFAVRQLAMLRALVSE